MTHNDEKRVRALLGENVRYALDRLNDVQRAQENGRRDKAQLEIAKQALIRLNDQTSEMLKQIQTKEWADTLRDKTIANVLELHERFNREIMKELEGK